MLVRDRGWDPAENATLWITPQTLGREEFYNYWADDHYQLSLVSDIQTAEADLVS
jgi:hypothetical protein